MNEAESTSKTYIGEKIPNTSKPGFHSFGTPELFILSSVKKSARNVSKSQMDVCAPFNIRKIQEKGYRNQAENIIQKKKMNKKFADFRKLV